MISQVEPGTRLRLLSEYMELWVDKWPAPIFDFDLYLYNQYSHLIPGTVEHGRKNATHCYYCGRVFKQDPTRIATVDHWVPKSKGKTDRFVICCAHCNSNKGNAEPSVLLRRITNAQLKGLSVFGFKGKELRIMFEAVHEISNNITYRIGPRIYYTRKVKK